MARAKTARVTRTSTRMAPKSTRRLRSVGRSAARHPATGAGSCAATTSSTAYSRVDNRIEQIHGEIAQHEQGGDEEDGALDQRVVPLDHRPQEQTAYSGQGEDLLGHHRATEQIADLDPRDGDQGDQAVLEGMTPHHAALGQTFGARRPDEIRSEEHTSELQSRVEL